MSGRTGESLWRCPLDERLHESLYSDRADELHRGCQMQTATVKETDLVITLFGKHLLGVDLQTGTPAWPQHELNFETAPESGSGDSEKDSPRDSGLRTVRSPVIRDLNGDGNSDVLVWHWQPNEESGQMRAIDLAALKSGVPTVLWERKLRPTERHDDLRHHSRSDWSLVEDLNDDGSAEVSRPMSTESFRGLTLMAMAGVRSLRRGSVRPALTRGIGKQRSKSLHFPGKTVARCGDGRTPSGVRINTISSIISLWRGGNRDRTAGRC